MKIIGLTGRSGCGKSTVAQLYRELGYQVADADVVAREVLMPGSPCIPLLQAAFGKDITDDAGAVRRRLLADRAFGAEGGAEILVRITHGEIIRRLLRQTDEAKAAGEELFFVDGAVIVGAPFEKYCDQIILVTAPREASIRRICARDGIGVKSAETRLDAQIPEEELRRASAYEIKNDGSREDLIYHAQQVLMQLKGGVQ